jgi:hypothetical protein
VDNAQPDIDWDWIYSQMSDCPWSGPARDAGLWAIDTLRKELGPRWPKAWAEPGAAPPELVFSGSMLSGLASTLGLALAFFELRSLDGIAPLRAAVRQTARADALASPRLQLRVASMAASLGLRVELEPRLPDAETRADLLIRSEHISIAVEALAVLRDQRSIEADKWLGPFNIALIQIGQRHGVDFKGAIDTPLDEADTAVLLAEVERWAAGVAMGLTMPDLRKGGVTLGVVPGDGLGGKINFRYPVVAFDRRLQNKLSDKARQTRRSGADWLLIDSLDHLWHLTGWSQMHLADKARALAGLIRAQLKAEPHLLGAVITDGAALWRPEAEEQTFEVGEDAFALSRRIDKGNIRESVVVPLQGLGLEAAQLWRKVLDAESDWLGKALQRVGLEAPPELVDVGPAG